MTKYKTYHCVALPIESDLSQYVKWISALPVDMFIIVGSWERGLVN